MERGSTYFLRAAVVAIGLFVLGVCLLVLVPALIEEDESEFRLLIIGLETAAIPFFIALYQTLRLLGYIDRNKAFSELSVTALKRIKQCALGVSAIFLASLPTFYVIAEKDDAPGVVLVGLVLVFAPITVAVFAAVLQKLLKNAIDLKSENELTV